MRSTIIIPTPPVPGLVSLTACFGAVVTTTGIIAIALSIWLVGWHEGWGTFILIPFLPFVGFGFGLLALAFHFHKLAQQPLTIKPTGRVLYRGTTLFEKAQKLVVRCQVFSGEGGQYERFSILAEIADGHIAFPSPYFDTFSTLAEADAAAVPIAKALCISIVLE